MEPLVAVAAATFPAIIDLVRSDMDEKSPLVTAVAKAVTDTTGATTADDAKAKLAADPKVADALRFSLAAISVDKSLIAQQPDSSGGDFRADLDNTTAARQALLELVKKNDPISWTPSIISYIIVVGFLVVLALLVEGHFAATLANDKVAAVLNLCLGALTTAFATVLNFWLGSSLGSQRKDTSLLTSNALQQVKAAVPGRAVPPAGQAQ